MKINEELSYIIKECINLTVDISEEVSLSENINKIVIIEKNNAIKNLLKEAENVVSHLFC